MPDPSGLQITLSGPAACGKTRVAMVLQQLMSEGELLPAQIVELSNHLPHPSGGAGEWALALMAMEYGFKAHERGLNLQAAAAEFRKVAARV